MNLSPLAAFTIVLLGLWLLASAVNQLPGRRLSFLKRHDVWALIPAWTFFAPNPGTTDYHLLYRDRYAGGSLSDWIEVHYRAPGGLLRGLWNPRKRESKALVDLVGELSALAADFPPEHLTLSMAYVTLTSAVGAQPRSPLVQARQWMILESFGHYTSRSPRVRFVSGFHSA